MKKKQLKHYARIGKKIEAAYGRRIGKDALHELLLLVEAFGEDAAQDEAWEVEVVPFDAQDGDAVEEAGDATEGPAADEPIAKEPATKEPVDAPDDERGEQTAHAPATPRSSIGIRDVDGDVTYPSITAAARAMVELGRKNSLSAARGAITHALASEDGAACDTHWARL